MPNQSEPGPEAPKPKWYHNIWVILFLLLFVLGPFGLPLVWKNPRLSRATKNALTLVMAAYTIFLIITINQTIQSVQTSLNSFNATLQY